MRKFALKTLLAIPVTACLLAAPSVHGQEKAADLGKPIPAVATKTDATPLASEEEPLPVGAPSDDYEFVAWCKGVLTGHMQLYQQVRPELDAISMRWNSLETDHKDQAEQQLVGADLLAQFTRAMSLTEAAGGGRTTAERGQRAVQTGLRRWSDISTVDAAARAYSWMNFGLPGRCEKTAAALERRSSLMAAAFGVVVEQPKPAPAPAVVASAGIAEPAPAVPVGTGGTIDALIAPTAEKAAPSAKSPLPSLPAPDAAAAGLRR